MAEYLMKRHATPGAPLPVITPDLKRTMMTYNWPGNVRELENVVRKLLILGDADLIARELQGKTTRRALIASAGRRTHPGPYPLNTLSAIRPSWSRLQKRSTRLKLTRFWPR